MKKIKVGMISFAHAGHPDSYMKYLTTHPSVEVIGIADDELARVQKYIDSLGIKYYADYEDLLKTDCDAVFICSEYVDHAQMTIDAAKAGKHVFCEKPLGLSINEMNKMIAVCEDRDVQLMTAFPARYSTPMIEAKAMLDRGDIGEVLAIKGTNRGVNPGGWFLNPAKSGGGALMDHTVHVMDLMNWFLDVPVKEVYAVADTLFYDVEVEDAGIVHVTFNNGVIGVIDTSWSLCKSFPRTFDLTLHIIGTNGVLAVDALAQSNALYSDQAMKTEWVFWGDEMDEYLVNAFIDALIDGKEVPITGVDGLNATSIALAAYESFKRERPILMESFLQDAEENKVGGIS